MATALKDLYNLEFFTLFSELCEKDISNFNREVFLSELFNKDWEGRELKDRMKWSSICFRSQLERDFEIALEQLCSLVERLKKTEFYETSVEFMFLPGIIENFGLEYFNASVKAMTSITSFTTCEFAVRPFYLRYPEQMLQQTIEWSLHSDFKVRRLASEGIRPMLPWAVALNHYKKDPTDIIPILENLKDDPEEFVRRSVANNLNDISKNQPEIVLDIAKQWYGENENRNKLVKHALRTLLKQGNPKALSHFNYAHFEDLGIWDFSIFKSKNRIEDKLSFSFKIKNKSNKEAKIRLEYAIYFLKANGQHSKKVFKISERNLSPNEQIEIVKEHSLRIITTRVFYPGNHNLSLIVNGNESEVLDFDLLPKA